MFEIVVVATNAHAQTMAISIEDGSLLKLGKAHLTMSWHCLISPSRVGPVQVPQE